MSEVSNKRFVHFDGTKQEFIKGGYDKIYPESVVFINGDGDENNSMIYTHGEYYGKSVIVEGDASTSAELKNSDNVSVGAYSFAEGVSVYTIGYASHAEGGYTTASGDYSHVSGYGTLADNMYEFACGKYNKSDQGTLFSIGCGENHNNRKNAMTIIGGDEHEPDYYTIDFLSDLSKGTFSIGGYKNPINYTYIYSEHIYFSGVYHFHINGIRFSPDDDYGFSITLQDDYFPIIDVNKNDGVLIRKNIAIGGVPQNNNGYGYGYGYDDNVLSDNKLYVDGNTCIKETLQSNKIITNELYSNQIYHNTINYILKNSDNYKLTVSYFGDKINVYVHFKYNIFGYTIDVSDIIKCIPNTQRIDTDFYNARNGYIKEQIYFTDNFNQIYIDYVTNDDTIYKNADIIFEIYLTKI